MLARAASVALASLALFTAMPRRGASQATSSRASIGAIVGLAVGSEPAAFVGLGLRARLGHRLALSASLNRWSIGVGCDAIIGAPCDTSAWSADLGPVITIGSPARPVQSYLAARIGGLRYSRDRSVWAPNIGAGLTWRRLHRLGFTAELRYHMLFSNRPSTQAYRPSTSDRLSGQAGIELHW